LFESTLGTADPEAPLRWAVAASFWSLIAVAAAFPGIEVRGPAIAPPDLPVPVAMPVMLEGAVQEEEPGAPLRAPPPPSARLAVSARAGGRQDPPRTRDIPAETPDPPVAPAETPDPPVSPAEAPAGVGRVASRADPLADVGEPPEDGHAAPAEGNSPEPAAEAGPGRGGRYARASVRSEVLAPGEMATCVVYGEQPKPWPVQGCASGLHAEARDAARSVRGRPQRVLVTLRG
jgi:hypothetical protein